MSNEANPRGGHPPTAKMRIRQSITFLLLCFLIACSDSGNALSPIQSLLIGKWWWLESRGGFGGSPFHRDSTSTTTMEFSPDAYNIWHNDTLIARFSYTLGRDDVFSTSDPLLRRTVVWSALPHPDDVSQTVHFQTPDTLILYDTCIDCYDHIWTRLR